MAAGTLDELLVALGFEYDPEDLQRFTSDIDSTVSIIKKLVTVAIAGATAITGMTIASTAASDEQGKLADELDETVGTIDALQFALERSGGSADGMVSSLRALTDIAGKTARGVGGGVQAFSMLGIDVSRANGQLKTSSELLLEISSEFQNLSRHRQIDLAGELGIRDSVRLLQQGPEAIRALVTEAEALGVTTEEDARISAEFQDSLTNTWKVIKDISRLLSREFVPILKEAKDQFVEWWIANRDLIEQKLPEWIEKAAQGLRLLSVGVGVFLAFRLASHLIALIALFRGLSIATLIANAAVLILPGLIFSAITALALLADDAKVFFEGGDSFMGDMIKKFPEWENQIIVVGTALNIIAELTGMIFEGWAAIFELFSNFKLPDALGFIKNLPGFLGDITGLAPVEGGGLLSNLGERASNASSTFVDKVEIVVQGGVDSASIIADNVVNAFQQASQDLQSAVDQ